MAELVQIMNIGNDLTLSKSARVTFLLLTDLPATVSLHEINYELNNSESYSGVLNGRSCAIADYPYVMLLGATFHSLVLENYDIFILTVGSYAVAVVIVHKGVYKVFDSHGKDLLGQTDPLGTCTFIEIESLNEIE